MWVQDTNPSRRIVQKLAFVLGLGAFGAFYIAYAAAQTADLFYEAHFVHMDFIRALTTGNWSMASVLTTFGEHLFPGYNLILAANYYLFSIWGGFDTVVHVIAVIVTGCLLAYQLFLRSAEPISFAGLLLVLFLFFSPVNNTMWGMALAAVIGTTLVVASAMIIENHRMPRTGKLPALYVLVPSVILLFSAGYSIGYIAGLGTTAACSYYLGRISRRQLAILFLVVVASVVVYIIIISEFGTLSGNKPKSLISDIPKILAFACVMAGSSVLGTALYEIHQLMWPYYLAGAAIWFVAFGLFVSLLFRVISKKVHDNDLFLTLLLTYAATNILVVAAFRYQTVQGGPAGNWYVAHSKYLALGTLVGLFRSARPNTSQARYARAVVPLTASLMILIPAVFGFISDLKKAPYILAWKKQIIAQAPGVLASPADALVGADPTTTLFWYADVVKPGLDLLYRENLWLFRDRKAQVHGRSERWLTAEERVTIICPSGTGLMSFLLFRPEDWPASTIALTSNSGVESWRVSKERVRLTFPSGIAAVTLSAENATLSSPISPMSDPRHLVAVVREVACD